jgi:hypothetical protein
MNAKASEKSLNSWGSNVSLSFHTHHQNHTTHAGVSNLSLCVCHGVCGVSTHPYQTYGEVLNRFFFVFWRLKTPSKLEVISQHIIWLMNRGTCAYLLEVRLCHIYLTYSTNVLWIYGAGLSYKSQRTARKYSPYLEALITLLSMAMAHLEYRDIDADADDERGNTYCSFYF